MSECSVIKKLAVCNPSKNFCYMVASQQCATSKNSVIRFNASMKSVSKNVLLYYSLLIDKFKVASKQFTISVRKFFCYNVGHWNKP